MEESGHRAQQHGIFSQHAPLPMNSHSVLSSFSSLWGPPVVQLVKKISLCAQSKNKVHERPRFLRHRVSGIVFFACGRLVAKKQKGTLRCALARASQLGGRGKEKWPLSCVSHAVLWEWTCIGRQDFLSGATPMALFSHSQSCIFGNNVNRACFYCWVFFFSVEVRTFARPHEPVKSPVVFSYSYF